MKKNYIALISVVATLLIIVAVVVYKKSVSGNETSAKSESTVSSETDSTNVEDELAKLELLGTQNCGRYVYKEKLLRGEIDKLDKRITRADAERIISENSGFENIIKAFQEFQPDPDFTGGSGITVYEYWMDDSGTEMIKVLVEQSEVWYYNTENNKSEKLLTAGK